MYQRMVVASHESWALEVGPLDANPIGDRPTSRGQNDKSGQNSSSFFTGRSAQVLVETKL